MDDGTALTSAGVPQCTVFIAYSIMVITCIPYKYISNYAVLLQFVCIISMSAAWQHHPAAPAKKIYKYDFLVMLHLHLTAHVIQRSRANSPDFCERLYTTMHTGAL
jgi:hypothetical protein